MGLEAVEAKDVLPVRLYNADTSQEKPAASAPAEVNPEIERSLKLAEMDARAALGADLLKMRH
jgi:hypothetical protein